MDPMQKIEENLRKGEYKSALEAYKEALNAYTRNSQKLSQAEQKALYEELKKEYSELEEFRKMEKKTSGLYYALNKCKAARGRGLGGVMGAREVKAAECPGE